MTDRRVNLLSIAVIAVVALAVRAWAAASIPFPRPEDTAYYVGVAGNLLDGRGLVSDALWSYGTPPLVFPRPAFEVWLPLPTFLAAIPMAIAGSTFAAAQVSSVVIGSLVPVLAWWIAREVAVEAGLPTGRIRMVALGAGITSAVYLPLVLHSALPDSTMPFAVLVLIATILMARILRDPDGRLADPRLYVLGAALGLAALTRNEVVWLAATWVLVVAVAPGQSARLRVGRIAVVAIVSLLIFAPWAIRDWQVFGSPLPGQAIANGLSLDGRDIFAWNAPPTLDRYLAAGPATLLGLRVTGTLHNLLNVLLFLGIPISCIGIVGLLRVWRGRALRPLLVFSALTFLATSLLFPVATTWGTFLHAAGPVQVLLVVSAMLALDAAVAWLGRRLGWTRPIAWLGPAMGIFGSVLFTLVFIPSFGAGSRATADLYTELGRRMAAAGHPLDAAAGPVITNFPIWLAEVTGADALALPEESPADVLDLAATFPGTRLLIVMGDDHGRWPAVLDGSTDGADCFRELDLGAPSSGLATDPLADTRAFEIVCP
jgi:hypothetical protein